MSSMDDIGCALGMWFMDDIDSDPHDARTEREEFSAPSCVRECLDMPEETNIITTQSPQSQTSIDSVRGLSITTRLYACFYLFFHSGRSV